MNGYKFKSRAYYGVSSFAIFDLLDVLYGCPPFPPNPLHILARAINRLKLRTQIHQPCWRQGRWKSLT